MVHCPLLLTHWLSLWYTTLSYWPTGYQFGILLSSTDPLDISMVHYLLLLAHWISLLYTSIFYWPTGYLFGTIPSPIGNHYGTLLPSSGPLEISMVHPSPIDPLAISNVHSYLLLAHWISLWYTPHPY